MVDSQIYVIHENDAWSEPLARELTRLGAPFELWFLDEGALDLSQPPPPGVFYNRMSASSHTRDHRYAPEYTGCVLRWLESHGRAVLNGSQALALEISKVAQYAALATAGIRSPRTIAAVGRDSVVTAGERLDGPIITKHNRGGKGLGVRKFEGVEALRAYVDSDDYSPSVDGVTLVQAYIESPGQFITRCEFIGGKFLYAVRVDTSAGFELCPADACGPDGAFCPAESPTAGVVGNDSIATAHGARAPFEIIEDFDSPLIREYEAFLHANRIDIAAIEFVVDSLGTPFTYDVNTNTNYNPAAEANAGRNAMGAIARHLQARLAGRRHVSTTLRNAS